MFKDGTHRPIIMGVNWNGISVFESGQIVNTFLWANIVKLSFKRRNFLLRMKTINSNNVSF